MFVRASSVQGKVAQLQLQRLMRVATMVKNGQDVSSCRPKKQGGLGAFVNYLQENEGSIVELWSKSQGVIRMFWHSEERTKWVACDSNLEYWQLFARVDRDTDKELDLKELIDCPCSEVTRSTTRISAQRLKTETVSRDIWFLGCPKWCVWNEKKIRSWWYRVDVKIQRKRKFLHHGHRTGMQRAKKLKDSRKRPWKEKKKGSEKFRVKWWRNPSTSKRTAPRREKETCSVSGKMESLHFEVGGTKIDILMSCAGPGEMWSNDCEPAHADLGWNEI